MTDNPKALFSSRTSTREFLSYKAAAAARSARYDDLSASTLADLSEAFPGILFGTVFITQALESFRSTPSFASMAIRIDGGVESGEKPSTEAAEARVDVLETLDSLCGTHRGVWGLIGENFFGAFFPDLQDAECMNLARTLQRDLADIRSETITIGVAAYPTLSDERDRVLENARKALDHAAFFGPNSTAAFDSVSLNISGDILYQDGDLKGAIEEYHRALEIDPSNVNVHNSLGVCHGDLASYEEALASFESVMRLDANEIMAPYNTGLVLALTDHRVKALEYFTKALDIRQDVFEVVYQMGRCHLALEQYPEAKGFIDKAIRLKPDSASALSCIGQYYAATNEQEKAIEAFESAIKKNPNDADALSGIGHLYDLRDENADIALLFCKQSIDISPENGLFHQRLGQLYLKRHIDDKAMDAFRTATDLGCDATEWIETIQDRRNDDTSH
ncbi:MAG: tetratricopeptide repeat protein [Desulfobacterales bacterium]